MATKARSDAEKAKAKEKSVVVVLGMHRSGTSAVTKGLEVLGVDLGPNLMPALPNVNDKGFFEDLEINAINVELLREAGQDWHTLAFVPSSDLLHERHAPLRLRAIEVLRTRFRNVDRFGMKDPRLCRLLPFWQQVFEHLRLKVYYVIVVRNPLSVARSLERVYKLPPEKVYYLWLEHVLPSIRLTEGLPRVVVDYDVLMEAPEKQIARIARTLGIGGALNRARLTEFTGEFLEERLRHARFAPDDLFLDPLVPIPVRSAFTVLVDVAADKIGLDSEVVATAFKEISAQMDGMAQAMGYMFRLDNIIVDLSQSLRQQNEHIGTLSQNLSEQGGQIDALTRAIGEGEARAEELAQRLAERDSQIESLQQTVDGLEGQSAELTEGVSERERRIEALVQALEEKEALAAELGQRLAEREKQVEDLTQTLGRQDEQSAALSQGVAERQQQIEALEQTLAEKEALAAGLAQRLTDREGELEALTQSLDELRTQAGELAQRLAERDRQVETLEAAVAEGQVHAGQLARQLQGRDAEVEALTRSATDSQANLESLTQEIQARDSQIAALSQAARDSEARAAELGRQLAASEGQIEAWKQTAAESNALAADLTQKLVDRENQVAALRQSLRERDAQADALAHGLAVRDGQIAELSAVVAQKESAIQQLAVTATQLSYRLDKTRSSRGWKLLKPARAIRGLPNQATSRLGAELLPFSQLHAEGEEWVATGTDAQFLLMGARAWHALTGWYWLELDAASGEPLDSQLYFDIGAGFDPTKVINFQINGKGVQRIPIYVPMDCRAIRLDPCDFPARFKLSKVALRRLRNAPALPAELIEQAAVYEELGGREGNVPGVAPVNQIHRDSETDYCWRSEGEDPWFVLNGIGPILRPGWCSIEMRIRSNIGRGNARMYFDYGEGYAEADSIVLPFGSGELVERLYLLKSTPQRIRLDPFDCSARFSIERLNLRSVSPVPARQRMLRRLCEQSEAYKGRLPAYAWKDIRKSAREAGSDADQLLYDRYNETYSLNWMHNAVSYADWIERNELPEQDSVAFIQEVQRVFEHKPVVSVLMATYDVAETYLREAIESVLAQSYPHWELCIADDASTEPHVRNVLEDYASQDRRVKVLFREANGHISAASNSALTLAEGEYVALMDHDDKLAPHALHFVVEAINRVPEAQVIYSDEDKIDEKGKRSDPHFKSDWNPDLFLSQNYVSHLGVYRRDLLERIGGFREGVEGSQDYDLLLRCLSHVGPDDIVHIPKVLYHWRKLEGSTSLAAGEKRYTTDAGVKALQDFFAAQGRDHVGVEPGLMPNTYRIRYPIPQPEPLVSLLIPTRDKRELLEPCVGSILDKTSYQNFEIIILDNESAEPATLEYFENIQEHDARVRVVPYHQPFNYSAINNFGVTQARGELIGLVNNDVEVITAEWLAEMVSHAVRPEIGCVGAKLYYDDETIQHAGVIVGLGGVAGHSHKYFPRTASGYFHRLKLTQNLSAVTAACLVVRKSIFEQVGGLEEEGLRIAFNDVDFCLKVQQAGFRNLWTPYAELYHHESKSRGAEDTPEKIERFNSEIEFVRSKWGDRLRRDRYYNPNLTLAREDYSLR